jgi:hypothetical protein
MSHRIAMGLFCLSVAGLTGGCERGAAGECRGNADCVNSQAAIDIGRCGARDVWCHEGACNASCREPCETVAVDVSSCGTETGLVCNQSERTGQGQLGYCTALPIPCETAADCPAYRPPADVEDAAWECLAGICRYPGFEYLID